MISLAFFLLLFNDYLMMKCNDAGVVLGGHTVIGEQRVEERTQHTPRGIPVLPVLELDVWLWTLTDWGLSVRKFSNKLQREGVSPSVRSLSVSLWGITVLNAEL